MVEESPSFDSFVPTARKIARWASGRIYERYFTVKRIESEDLFAVAFGAVWMAWRDYKDDGRATLSTYCRSRATWACQDYCRTFLSRCGSREKFFLPNVVSLNAPLTEDLNSVELGDLALLEPDFTNDFFLDHDEARSYLDCLDPRSRYVVVETVMEGRTLLALGEEIGLTEGRIWQIRKAALQRIYDHSTRLNLS